MKKVKRDFSLADHGSIYLLKPLTPRAVAWRRAHLPEDAQIWAGAVVVEHRCIVPIVEGILADDLTVRRV